MSKLRGLIAGLLVALAVSACGSSEQASTSTTTASVASQSSPQAVTPNTGPTETQPGTSKALAPKVSEAKRRREQQASKRAKESVKRTVETVRRKISAAAVKRQIQAAARKTGQIVAKGGLQNVERQIEVAAAEPVPFKKQFNQQEKSAFIADCKAVKGSRPTCECVLVKQELRHVETARSLAELLALEYGLQAGSTLPQIISHGTAYPGSGALRVPLPAGIRQSVKACLA